MVILAKSGSIQLVRHRVCRSCFVPTQQHGETPYVLCAHRCDASHPNRVLQYSAHEIAVNGYHCNPMATVSSLSYHRDRESEREPFLAGTPSLDRGCRILASSAYHLRPLSSYNANFPPRQLLQRCHSVALSDSLRFRLRFLRSNIIAPFDIRPRSPQCRDDSKSNPFAPHLAVTIASFNGRPPQPLSCISLQQRNTSFGRPSTTAQQPPFKTAIPPAGGTSFTSFHPHEFSTTTTSANTPTTA